VPEGPPQGGGGTGTRGRGRWPGFGARRERGETGGAGLGGKGGTRGPAETGACRGGGRGGGGGDGPRGSLRSRRGEKSPKLGSEAVGTPTGPNRAGGPEIFQAAQMNGRLGVGGRERPGPVSFRGGGQKAANQEHRKRRRGEKGVAGAGQWEKAHSRNPIRARSVRASTDSTGKNHTFGKRGASLSRGVRSRGNCVGEFRTPFARKQPGPVGAATGGGGAGFGQKGGKGLHSKGSHAGEPPGHRPGSRTVNSRLNQGPRPRVKDARCLRGPRFRGPLGLHY